MWQTVLVIAVVAAAFGYAGFRLYEAIRQPDNPCRHCQGCALSDAKRKIEASKKSCEKFGGTK